MMKCVEAYERGEISFRPLTGMCWSNFYCKDVFRAPYVAFPSPNGDVLVKSYR